MVRLDEKRNAVQAVAEKLKEVRRTLLQGGKSYEVGYEGKKGKAA